MIPKIGQFVYYRFCDVTLMCHFICTLDGKVNGIFWRQRLAILIT